MATPIRYYSTNRNVPRRPARGPAPGPGGRPRPLPARAAARRSRRRSSRRSRGQPYPEVAFAVLRRSPPACSTTTGCGPSARTPTTTTCRSSTSTRPHATSCASTAGPTASFKDFAARMMARWMGALMERGRAASSSSSPPPRGDTGSAVAHAFHGVPGVQRASCSSRCAEVSDRQRKQMTTLGGNVTTLRRRRQVRRLPGDGQARLRRPGARGIRLTSANSINIGRLLPQSVYYVYAYARSPTSRRRRAASSSRCRRATSAT